VSDDREDKQSGTPAGFAAQGAAGAAAAEPRGNHATGSVSAVRSSTGFHEQLPHPLGQHRGFVGAVTGFHALQAIAFEDVDRKARVAFGRDRYAAEGARFPQRVPLESAVGCHFADGDGSKKQS
jgi:hypothetical protein